jgi:hypothetical protein
MHPPCSGIPYESDKDSGILLFKTPLVFIPLDEAFDRRSQFRDATKGFSIDNLFFQRPKETFHDPIDFRLLKEGNTDAMPKRRNLF